MRDDQEHAVAIARVSSLKQREEDQRPGLTKFADGQGYKLDAMVEIHGRSAFHGKHLKQVLQAIEDYVRNGDATVVIFRDVDRSSRQGAQATYDLRGQIIKAGGRMEFAGQEYLNDQRNQDMLLGILATAAREESETKSRRKLQGNEARAARGEVNGRPAWGYDLCDADGKQILIPNDLGRKWIPIIFHAAVDGESLRSIQTMLRGVPSPQKNGVWNEATIRRIIASPTYYGGRAGKGNMQYEALVTTELWLDANKAVKARTKTGRSTTKREPALARPICGACYGVNRDGAPGGRSPMYRKSRLGHDYYTCTGQGAARKSCGAKVIPCDRLDAAVDAAMAKRSGPYYELEWIAGDDKAQQLADINEKIAAAAKEGRYDLIPGLSAEAEELNTQPVRKARAVKRESGKTVGEHWQTLDTDGKRDELLKWEIIAHPDGRVSVEAPWQDVPAASLPAGVDDLPADHRPAMRGLVLTGILLTCAFRGAIMAVPDSPLCDPGVFRGM
jgi:DNA invertase Pin-like site-specific DNA recombinase